MANCSNCVKCNKKRFESLGAKPVERKFGTFERKRCKNCSQVQMVAQSKPKTKE